MNTHVSTENYQLNFKYLLYVLQETRSKQASKKVLISTLIVGHNAHTGTQLFTIQ